MNRFLVEAVNRRAEEVLEDWPVEGDLVVPIKDLPESLKESMGAEWRLRQKNQKVLREQNRE